VGSHKGRILRLFGRGHKEEPNIIALLQSMGIEVRAHSQRLIYFDGCEDVGGPYECQPWEDQLPIWCEDVSSNPHHLALATALGSGPAQWTFSGVDGHFGGSCDGQLLGLDPAFGLEGPGLLETKTHGEKSFIDIAGKLDEYRKYVTAPDTVPFPGKGVISSKIEHYAQMQTYMHNFKLKWALYVAICKNTDDLYMEIIHYKPEVAEAYDDRARHVVAAQHPPARISENSSWWECKFCDYRELCHHAATPHKNCRSCIYARPIANGDWMCDKYRQNIPPDFMVKGCASWDPILG